MSIELHNICTLIEVFDMDKSIEFYRQALGFQVHQSAGSEKGLGWAWLKRGDMDLMLNSMFNPGENPPSPDALRSGHHRDICLYFGCPDVDGAYAHLTQMS